MYKPIDTSDLLTGILQDLRDVIWFGRNVGSRHNPVPKVNYDNMSTVDKMEYNDKCAREETLKRAQTL